MTVPSPDCPRDNFLILVFRSQMVFNGQARAQVNATTMLFRGWESSHSLQFPEQQPYCVEATQLICLSIRPRSR